MNTEWKLVPVEPVDEQQLAGAQAIRMDTTPLNKMFTANRVYREMIAAAPPAPTSHPIPTGATGEDERQAFEAWADDNGFALDCDFFEVSGQYYDHDDTQLAYDIWRAARASVGAPAAGDAEVES